MSGSCHKCTYNSGSSVRPKCETCDWTYPSSHSNYRREITQQAARDLLAACATMYGQLKHIQRKGGVIPHAILHDADAAIASAKGNNDG